MKNAVWIFGLLSVITLFSFQNCSKSSFNSPSIEASSEGELPVTSSSAKVMMEVNSSGGFMMGGPMTSGVLVMSDGAVFVFEKRTSPNGPTESKRKIATLNKALVTQFRDKFEVLKSVLSDRNPNDGRCADAPTVTYSAYRKNGQKIDLAREEECHTYSSDKLDAETAAGLLRIFRAFPDLPVTPAPVVSKSVLLEMTSMNGSLPPEYQVESGVKILHDGTITRYNGGKSLIVAKLEADIVGALQFVLGSMSTQLVDADPNGPMCAGSSTIQFAGYATDGRKVELETRSGCHVYTANEADAYMLARVLENLYRYIELEQ